MSFQFAMAKAVGATLTWGLRNVMHRPAGNMPGKIALYVDPQLIADLRPRLREGSIVVVGTNGKTSVTNLLADVFEQAGKKVACNRSGANLDSGIATTLLQTKSADWGVFESDELWLARVLPFLKADYLVLLNLFPDQLDRVGELRHIQDSIVKALSKSPTTTLIYNADDPQCAAIALEAPNPSIPFGVGEDMHLPKPAFREASMCQRCEGMLEFAYKQYGDLGAYACESCGFARPELAYAASQVQLGAMDLEFTVTDATAGTQCQITSPQSTPYLVYNLLGAYVAASKAGVSLEVFQRSVNAFDPRNGRLQRYQIDGRKVLLNLAKNPTGFNQNLQIVARDGGPKAVALFVNNREGDGRDVSWLWDVEFESLTQQTAPMRVFVGGMCAQETKLRLRYAGIDAQVVGGIGEVFAALPGDEALPSDAAVFAIANYTALPSVHDELDAMAAQGAAFAADAPQEGAGDSAPESATDPADLAAAGVEGKRAVLVHLLPDLLNLNGERGNVRIVEQRLRWGGAEVEVRQIQHGDPLSLEDADFVFIGNGPKREQALAKQDMAAAQSALESVIKRGGIVLAVGSGFAILSELLAGAEALTCENVLGFERSGAILAQDEELAARVVGALAARLS